MGKRVVIKGGGEVNDDSQPIDRRRNRRRSSDPSKSLAALDSYSAAKERTINALKAKIQANHQLCVASAIGAAEAAIRTGELLFHLRMHVGHGHFEEELRKGFAHETGLSIRTAQRYMKLFRRFRKFLGEHGVCPASQFEIVTGKKELLIAFCRREQSEREEQRHKDNSMSTAPFTKTRNVPRDVFYAMKPFMHERAHEIDFDPDAESYAYGDRCILVSVDHQRSEYAGTIRSLVSQVKCGSFQEIVLWIEHPNQPLPDQIWQFPIAVWLRSFSSPREKAPSKQPVPDETRPFLVYLSLAPRLIEFAQALNDIAVVFQSTRPPTDAIKTLDYRSSQLAIAADNLTQEPQ